MTHCCKPKKHPQKGGLKAKIKSNSLGLSVAAVTLILVIAGVVLAGNSSTPMAQSTGVLVGPEMIKDFGSVPISGNHVVLNYNLENKGDKPVMITKIATSCMCTKARLQSADGKQSNWGGMTGHAGSGPVNPNWTVAPGEKVTVVADFNPAAHGPDGIGSVQREVILTTTSKKTPTINLTLKGTVTRG